MTNRDFPDLVEADFDTLTPPEVERFNRYLVRELGSTQKILGGLQETLAQTESDLSLAMAKSRLEFGRKSRTDGKNYSETKKDEEALGANRGWGGAGEVGKEKGVG